MLVITRRTGESFSVDGPAKVTVLKSTASVVAFQVEAPHTTTILRADAKKREPPAEAKT